MKLHFEPNLDYQLQAVEAVCDLFRGQEVCRTECTVTMRAPTAVSAGDLFPGTTPQQLTLGMAESDLGIGNRLTLLDDELLKNLNDIQLRNGLPPSGSLASGDFTVEMETGTGKTYVNARIFEEEYKRAARLPEYNTLFNEVDLTRAFEEVHNGYFSIDRKGGWTDTEENNQSNRDNAERAYNLIMKEKEKLLSFETPLKFIFSHSALREGRDNPNVFQICALRDIQTERERRQTIGRGLRLCVNQEGQRLRGQHADGHCHRELRAVRREPTEGDRGRHRDSLWYCRSTSVRSHRGHGRARQDHAPGLRAVEGIVGALEGAGAY